MKSTFNGIFETLLVSSPVKELDNVEQFISELQFICREFIEQSPTCLYKDIPLSKKPSTAFRCKNRHRVDRGHNSRLFELIAADEDAYRRSLDVSAQPSGTEENCVVFIPDGFQISHSMLPYDALMEASQHVDVDPIVKMSYSQDISNLTEQAQHVVITNVPFYYCIRLK